MRDDHDRDHRRANIAYVVSIVALVLGAFGFTLSLVHYVTLGY